MTCGKPDISIIRKRDAVTVGSIETKDINKPDLEGKGRNQEQFDRYKKAMNHAVFTDYLRFLFYESGNDTPILDIRIGTCQNDEIIPDIEKANSYVRSFANTSGRRFNLFALLQLWRISWQRKAS